MRITDLGNEAAIAAGILKKSCNGAQRPAEAENWNEVQHLGEAQAAYGIREPVSGELEEALRLLRSVYQRLMAQKEETPAEGMAEVEIGENLSVKIDGREISITPLPKALFLLFLRHPEGIMFKDMADYREELIELYCRTSRRDSRELCERSIDRLLNPGSNSLDTQRYLLRRQFEAQLDKSEAGKYCILGLRGEKKSVRALVKKSSG